MATKTMGAKEQQARAQRAAQVAKTVKPKAAVPRPARKVAKRDGYGNAIDTLAAEATANLAAPLKVETAKPPRLTVDPEVKAQQEADAQKAKQDHAEARRINREAQANEKATAKAERDRVRAEKQDAKVAEKPQRPDLGERYNAAAALVGDLRKKLFDALDRKKALTTESPEVENLNAEIRVARENLEGLLHRKRELAKPTKELETAAADVRRFRKERDAARQEKKAAYREAAERLGLTNQDAVGDDSPAAADADADNAEGSDDPN